MKTRDVFSYSSGAIRLRKLRAGLTTLGIVIGIAAIVALLSISQGLQIAITGQLQKGLATDTLIISAGGGGFGGGFGGGDSGILYVNDTKTIQGISGVDIAVATIQRICYSSLGGRTLRNTIVGVDFVEYQDVYSTTIAPGSGSIPSNPENTSVVVGKTVVDPFQNGTARGQVGDNIQIIWTDASARPPRNVTFTGHIDAVLKEIGGLGLGGPSDPNIYISISEAQTFFKTNQSDLIIVKLNNDDKALIDSVSQAIRDKFSHQVSVTSSTAILGTLASVFSILQLFLGGIAAISLLVAGIGIMNIMIVSLMERTREIGILKALGMRNRTVLLIFLSEATIIGLLGATIGVGSGWALANLVTIVFSGTSFAGTENQGAVAGGLKLTPVLTPTVFLGAMVFGLVVSIVFALYPAWRASRLKPVEALRYE
ncbi:ABC transporter permease [Candidatus Bathyarchaeota archaeon]|nr:ABC transporter permease [Candidatus Bathyarchaeota archaeon]